MMRHVTKGREPAAWFEFRKQKEPKPRFDQGPKAELRAALLEEQGYLCCYCMVPIQESTTRIEHWAPRSRFPALEVEFSNLLAACAGGEQRRNDDRPAEHHCDVAKGQRSITLDPRKPSCERFVVCTSRGELVPASGAPAFVRDDLNVLNLNVVRLQRARESMVEAVRRWAVDSGKTLSRAQLEKKIREFDTPNDAGRLQPFVGVAIAWLRKHAVQR